MNKYKIVSIILSIVSILSIGGMLYFAMGNSKEEPKSKEVTTTTTETTTTTTEVPTTKVSEIQQVVSPSQSVLPAQVAPVETTRTVVYFGKSYPVYEGGKMAGEHRIEIYQKQAEFEAKQRVQNQNQSKVIGGRGGLDPNSDHWKTTANPSTING